MGLHTLATTTSSRSTTGRWRAPTAQLRGHARHGECAYIAHYPTAWVALRAFKVGTRKPRVLSGLAFFYGFARAAWRRTEQVPEREYRRFTRRRELRRRTLAAVRIGSRV